MWLCLGSLFRKSVSIFMGKNGEQMTVMAKVWLSECFLLVDQRGQWLQEAYSCLFSGCWLSVSEPAKSANGSTKIHDVDAQDCGIFCAKHTGMDKFEKCWKRWVKNAYVVCRVFYLCEQRWCCWYGQQPDNPNSQDRFLHLIKLSSQLQFCPKQISGTKCLTMRLALPISKLALNDVFLGVVCVLDKVL